MQGGAENSSELEEGVKESLLLEQNPFCLLSNDVMIFYELR